jgi:iron complex outermembrane receptor protein
MRVCLNPMAMVRGSIGVSLLALACAQPAFAQSEPDDESEIVVTGTSATSATKTDTPILRIPQAIEVITVEELQDRGALNIREALKYTAGVYNGGDDSRGDFNIIRGFESILYVDGLKRNYGFVYMPRPEVATLERLEVLVGPASVLYGAGSSGGLTNLQSKRPQFDFGGSASLSYATHDRKEATIDVTGPLSETLAARFVGVVRDSDSRLDFTRNDRIVAQGALTWRPSDRTDITAIGIYQEDHNPPNYNVVPLVGSLLALPGDRIPDSRFFGEPGINRGDKEYTALSLFATHAFSDAFSIRSSSRYTWANTKQAEYYLATYLSPGGPLDPFLPGTTLIPRNLFAINIKYRTFNTDNGVAFKFDTGPASHQLIAGIDYSYFKQVSGQAFVENAGAIDVYNPVYGTAPPPVFTFFNTQILKQTGFYVQDQIDFGQVASLVLGIRRDRYSKVDVGADPERTNKTTKRAGLTINATSTLAPYLSYSESFLPISGLNQFGSTYQPLFGKQVEVGVKWQPTRATMLRVSLYDLKEDNALRTDPNNPLNSIQTGSVKAKGFEFQANHNVADDFSITAAFAYGKVRLSGENRQRDDTPQYLASIFGTKTVQLTDDVNMRIGGGVRYQGKQMSDPFGGLFVVETPSYTLVDAVVAFDYKDWTLQFNAINLFDDVYYPSCSAFGSCANGEPRTVQGTLTYKF